MENRFVSRSGMASLFELEREFGERRHEVFAAVSAIWTNAAHKAGRRGQNLAISDGPFLGKFECALLKMLDLTRLEQGVWLSVSLVVWFDEPAARVARRALEVLSDHCGAAPPPLIEATVIAAE